MPWKLLALITAGIIFLGIVISNTQKTTPGQVTLETTTSLAQATPEKKAKITDLKPKTETQRPQEPGTIQWHDRTDLPSIQSQSGGQTDAGVVPPWLELRKGAKAWTGDDGGIESTLNVCPSAYLFKKWFSSPTAVVPECSEKPRGIAVTVSSDQIFSSGLKGEYFIFIKADDLSWSGWTGSIGLQPRIPTNTKVAVSLPPQGEKWLFPTRTSADGHITLHTGATLQILAQDPKSGDRPDLYVQITGNSVDAGKKGWLHRLGLNVHGDVPLFFAPPNGIKPPAVAEPNEASSGHRIVIHGAVWSCPTIETLRKLIRASMETAEKEITKLSLRAYFEWNCELFTDGDVVYINDYEGPFARVHKSGELKEFWSLTSLLMK
jgi:hypothetical protein